MFGVSFWEVVVVAAVALLLIGPRDLPRIARMAGAALRKLRQTYRWMEDAAAFVDPAANGSTSHGDNQARDAQNEDGGG